jgi:hypothetical protein
MMMINDCAADYDWIKETSDDNGNKNNTASEKEGLMRCDSLDEGR